MVSFIFQVLLTWSFSEVALVSTKRTALDIVSRTAPSELASFFESVVLPDLGVPTINTLGNTKGKDTSFGVCFVNFTGFKINSYIFSFI